MEKNERKSLIIGIAVTAYMVMAYDTIQNMLKNGFNLVTFGHNAVAMVGSLGIGLLVFYLLIYKKK